MKRLGKRSKSVVLMTSFGQEFKLLTQEFRLDLSITQALAIAHKQTTFAALIKVSC